jgi:hypothetical protein
MGLEIGTRHKALGTRERRTQAQRHKEKGLVVLVVVWRPVRQWPFALAPAGMQSTPSRRGWIIVVVIVAIVRDGRQLSTKPIRWGWL